MAYISLSRVQANEGNSMLLPSDGIMTVKSSGATNLVVKYQPGSQTADDSGSITSNCLTMTMVVNEVGTTLTRDDIVDAVIAAASVAGGGNGPAIPVDLKGNSVTSLTISMGAL